VKQYYFDRGRMLEWLQNSSIPEVIVQLCGWKNTDERAQKWAWFKKSWPTKVPSQRNKIKQRTTTYECTATSQPSQKTGSFGWWTLQNVGLSYIREDRQVL